MRRNNIFYVAAAGSGKTTQLITHVLTDHTAKTGFVTYTAVNQKNVKAKIEHKVKFVPNRVKILGWYEFLLHYFILPYKGTIIPELKTTHIGFIFDSDYSPVYTTRSGKIRHKKYDGNLLKKYFTRDYKIHKDLTAEFAYLCIEANKQSVKKRLEEYFDILCFDEAQDFRGPDLKILKYLIRETNCRILIAGDPRQHTYSTTKLGSKKYDGRLDTYVMEVINTKKREWIKVDNMTLGSSHRSLDEICNFASALFPDMPSSVSCDCKECTERRNRYDKLKGVFMVREKDISDFSIAHSPLNLIYNDTERISSLGKRMTMGGSKGDEAASVLIYPTKDMSTYLFFNRNHQLNHITKCKLYVAITRAKYLVGIVLKDKHCNKKNNYQNSLLRDWKSPHDFSKTLFEDEIF